MIILNVINIYPHGGILPHSRAVPCLAPQGVCASNVALNIWTFYINKDAINHIMIALQSIQTSLVMKTGNLAQYS